MSTRRASLTYFSFSDQTQRIRRNLLLASLAALIIVTFDIQLRSLSHSGAVFENLDTEVVATVLAVSLVYLGVSFLWNELNEIGYWKKSAMDKDKQNINDLDDVHSIVQRLKQRLEVIERQKDLTSLDVNSMTSNEAEEIREIISDYKRSFHSLGRSVHYRVWAFDFVIPIIFGCAAFVGLLNKFWV